MPRWVLRCYQVPWVRSCPSCYRPGSGSRAPSWGSVIISIASLLILLASTGLGGYVVGTCAFMFAWLAFFPFVMGMCTRIDPLGRLGALCYGISAGAQSMGPTLAGTVSQRAGIHAWLAAAVLALPIGAIVILFALRSSRMAQAEMEITIGA